MSKDDEGALDPLDEQVVDVLLRSDRVIEQYKYKKRKSGGEVDFDQPSLTDRLLIAQIINQTAMVGAMGGSSGAGMTQDGIFKQLDALRSRLFEELTAHIDEVMTSSFHGQSEVMPAPPTPDELKALNAELAAEGGVDWGTINDLQPRVANRILAQFRYKQRRGPHSAFAGLDFPPMGHAVQPEPFISDAERQAALPGVGTIPVKMIPAQVHEKFEDVLFKASVSMQDAKRTLELLLTTPAGNEMLKLMVYDSVGIQKAREAMEKPKTTRGEYIGPPRAEG